MEVKDGGREGLRKEVRIARPKVRNQMSGLRGLGVFMDCF